jgi:hypothetical protein
MDQSLTTIHTNANFRVRISGSASLRVKPYHALTSHCNNFLDSRSDPDNVDPDNVELVFDGGVAFRPQKSYHEAVFPLGKV